MKRRTAVIFSGIAAAFVMVAVIGLFGLSGSQGSTAQAASVVQTDNGAALNRSGQLSEDVTTLQAEVVAYRQQLQEAYSALQQAYVEIQILQSGGARGFRNGGGLQQFEPSDQGAGNG
jgi:ABC-type antimicrobial peptide transport system permease subunit